MRFYATILLQLAGCVHAQNTQIDCQSLKESFSSHGACCAANGGAITNSVDLSSLMGAPCASSPFNVWVWRCKADTIDWCRNFVSLHAEHMRSNHVRGGNSNDNLANGPLRSVVTSYFTTEQVEAGGDAVFTISMTFADVASEKAHVALSLQQTNAPSDLGRLPQCPEEDIVATAVLSTIPDLADLPFDNLFGVILSILGLPTTAAFRCGISVVRYAAVGFGASLQHSMECKDGTVV